MIELRTQKDLRAVQSLGFCCICGKAFEPGEERNRQHVPPKAMFAVSDRTPPVILPAHATCNEAQSLWDAMTAQLIGPLHGSHAAPEDLKLRYEVFRESGMGSFSALREFPLEGIIFRWARYFHAALYREYLPDAGGNVFHPLPAGTFVDGRPVYEEQHISREVQTRFLKRQIKAGATDGLICYNGKCEYRCTWVNLDPPSHHRTFCLFGLRLYNWEELGDPRFGPMGCVGMYEAPIPHGAARPTRIIVPVSNERPLDPFAT